MDALDDAIAEISRLAMGSGAVMHESKAEREKRHIIELLRIVADKVRRLP